jgi:hypothetical protein
MMKNNGENINKTKHVPPMLKNLEKLMDLEFDYEINSVKLDDNDELNCKMYYYEKKTRSYSKQLINFYRNCKLQYILGQFESRLQR